MPSDSQRNPGPRNLHLSRVTSPHLTNNPILDPSTINVHPLQPKIQLDLAGLRIFYYFSTQIVANVSLSIVGNLQKVLNLDERMT